MSSLYSALKYEFCIEYNLSMGFKTAPHTVPFGGLSKRIWSIESILSSIGVELSLYTLFEIPWLLEYTESGMEKRNVLGFWLSILFTRPYFGKKIL